MFEDFVASLNGYEKTLHDPTMDQTHEEITHEVFLHVHRVEKEPPLVSIEDQIHEYFDE
jgi:hypothetical protein